MQKSNKVYQDTSLEKWRCLCCCFDNLILLEQCEICETFRIPQPKRLADKQFIQHKQAGIECLSAACKHFNSLTNDFCSKCGKPLYEEESEHASKKPSQKKKLDLINCLSCNFSNDPSNFKCVGCDKIMPAKKIPRKSASFKKAVFGMQKVSCTICNEPLRLINPYTGQTEDCMVCEEKYPIIIVKSLCIFCDNKLTAQEQTAHDEKCQQRIKFYKKEGNPTFERCTDLQVTTMIYMHKKSEALHFKKEKQLINRIRRLGYDQNDLENLHHYIMHYAPIIIHMRVYNNFHFFLKDTHYRNQFEISSMPKGSRSYNPRIQWEDRMFDKRHHSASGFQRVKYGTMNFTNDPSGVRACAGYGQSYFLLKSHVRDRCTITDMDSSSSSSTLGTFRFIYHLLMKLSDAELKSAFEGSKGKQMLSNVICAYKEIQIHGPVEFAKDIQRVYVSKAQLKMGDPQALLEQVKSFCAKNNVDYELFQNKLMASPFDLGIRGHIGIVAQKVPERLVGDKKELTEEDLKPRVPAPAPVPMPILAYGESIGSYIFGSKPADVYPSSFAPATILPPPKKEKY